MKSLKYIFIISLIFACFSCNDELEIAPEQSLNTEVALSNIEGLQTALNGAYNALQSVNYYGRDFLVMPEVEGNNVYLSIANSNRFVQSYMNQYLVTNGNVTSLWNIAYTTILRLNNIINNVDALEGDETIKSQLKAEALGLRGLVHFDLVRFFGNPYTNGSPTSDLGVPIVLESIIDEPARNTVDEVYNQIIEDLLAAKANASNDSRMQFSSDAAEALLARVYLYKGDNTAAIASATNLISNYELASDVMELWSGFGSSEEIFTLEFLPTETNGADNYGQIYNPSGYGDIRVTTDIFDLYEDNDTRKDLIYEFTNGELYNGKYLEQDGIPGLVSPKILRVAEMYLIRAEASFKNGDSAGALADLNALRSARGASELSSVSGIDDIINERRRELAFEGHNTFDFYRNGRPMIRQQCNTGIETASPECRINANDFQVLHPIPEREMLVNQNMVQNTGY